MSLLTHVPSDVDATAMGDYLDDCREVSGVLALPSRAPQPRPSAEQLPTIDLDTVAVLEGWGAYGS